MLNIGQILAKGAKIAYQTYKANAPKMLTGVAIVSAFTSTCATIPATVKAVRACDAEKERLGVEKLSFIDMVKISAKYYIFPAFALGISTAASVGVFNEEEDQKALLAAGLQLAEQNGKDILEASKEVVGEEKTKEIEDKAVEKKVERFVTNPSFTIQKFGQGDVIFVEPILGLPMEGDWNALDRANLIFNKRVLYDDRDPHWADTTWGDWWDILGIKVDSILKNVKCTQDIDIAEQDLVPFKLEALGKPAFLIRYRQMPFDLESLEDTLRGRLPWE